MKNLRTLTALVVLVGVRCGRSHGELQRGGCEVPGQAVRKDLSAEQVEQGEEEGDAAQAQPREEAAAHRRAEGADPEQG